MAQDTLAYLEWCAYRDPESTEKYETVRQNDVGKQLIEYALITV